MIQQKELLLKIITDNGGSRSFPKSSNKIMLAMLVLMVKEGTLMKLRETVDALVYALPDYQDV